MSALLDIRELSVAFASGRHRLQAVDGISLSVDPGEILGVVGESGCGKSVMAMSLLRLLPETAQVSGEAWFEGSDLMAQSERALRRVRGKSISFVFQEPMVSFNPLFTIGHQIAETLRKHLGLSRAQARQRVPELLRLVRIADPERRANEYPHQLSGGMCQRAMIAMAIACEPKLIVADEPTTALDVTIQAEVLDLLRDLRERLGMAVILITHNLGVVADIADRVAVLYAGRKVEEAPADEIFQIARHPYTAGLMAAVPRVGPQPERLAEIPGSVPALREPAPFCSFAGRCFNAETDCRARVPALTTAGDRHLVACFHQVEAGAR